MCGIAGIAGVHSPDDWSTVTTRMLSQLVRRGPDSEGCAQLGGVIFGHRRLAIFDPSPAGHQPMSTPDGDVTVVFNGAVYNFHELRAELESRGARFVSRTDTEVLLHGYRTWGIDELVGRSRGMFAYALWDRPRRTLYLVRDRLGVKPLLYARRGDTIAFASTLRSLRESGLLGDIDPHAVAEYLEHGYVPDHTAIQLGAEKLPPATIAEWRDGKLSLRQYWAPPEARPDGDITFKEAVDRTEALLTDAVRMRLFADVPVGALLSGGVDSALVCAAAARLGANLTAFTVATPGQRVDESDDARATAREIGIDLRVLPMSDEDELDLKEMTSAFAEPFAVQSALGMLRLSRTIRAAGIKVVITGDGGDDAFLGYDRHRLMRAVERVARFVPGGFGPGWRATRGFIPQTGMLRRGTHFIDYVSGGLGAYLRAHNGLPAFSAHGLTGERLRDQVPRSRSEPFSSSGRTLLTDYLRHDLRHQFVGEYLTKVDGSTMYYGLEARAPFFDHVLWEHAASLPYGIRLHDGQLKAVLRDIARRQVSERVALGQKRGFSIPVERWLAGRWRQEVQTKLRDSLLVREGWVDGRALDRVLRDPRAEGLGAHHLWYLLVLEEWMRDERAASVALAVLPHAVS